MIPSRKPKPADSSTATSVEATPRKVTNDDFVLTPDKIEAPNVLNFARRFDISDKADYDEEGGKPMVAEEVAEEEVTEKGVARRVDAFLKTHGLDDRATRALKGAGDDVACKVIAKDLSPRVRNPSAYVAKAVKNEVALERSAAEANEHQGHEGQDGDEGVNGQDGDDDAFSCFRGGGGVDQQRHDGEGCGESEVRGGGDERNEQWGNGGHDGWG